MKNKNKKTHYYNLESCVQQPFVGQSPFVSSIGPDVMDMPVDPNEPTYCVCRQVSFGQMVMCDNSEVCWLNLMNLFAIKLFIILKL